MPKTDDEFMSTLLADIEKREEARIENAKATLKKEILPYLRRRGIPTIQATYSGYGDSGSVQNVDYLDSENKPMVASRFRSSKAKAIDNKLYRLLCDFLPMGFENNDGGQGDITIDVQQGTITIEHQADYLQHHESVLEFAV